MAIVERTLLEMRSDIQTRLGFGMAGNAGVVNAPLIDSMLFDGQSQLYEQFDWATLKGVQERTTGTNQQFYDFPVDCSPDRIQAIFLTWGGQIHQLTEGIDYRDRSTNQGSIPHSFEIRNQIELWPVPQAQYPLRIEYVKKLGPFSANNDRSTLPSGMVYLHALINAKKHYRQPDADTYASQLEALLNRKKARNRKTMFERRGLVRTPYESLPEDGQRV